jgi:hypothetical protein
MTNEYDLAIKRAQRAGTKVFGGLMASLTDVRHIPSWPP